MKPVAFSLLFCTAICLAAEPVLAPNAPLDRPVEGRTAEMAEPDRAIAPYVAQAQATYPQVRERFLQGLPKGEHFFMTTRLRDDSGSVEQVFVLVQRIDGGQVSGRIASPIMRVRGFRNGDPYQFPESAMVDWLIAKPDGSEEGNVVGKFLDTYQRRK